MNKRRIEIIWKDPVTKKKVKAMSYVIDEPKKEELVMKLCKENILVIKKNKKRKYKEPVFEMNEVIARLQDSSKEEMIRLLEKE